MTRSRRKKPSDETPVVARPGLGRGRGNMSPAEVLAERARLLRRPVNPETQPASLDPVYGRQFKFFRKVYTEEVVDQMAEDLLEWLRDRRNYRFTQWCSEVGIPRQTGWELAQANEKFRAVWELAHAVQEEGLFGGLLDSRMDPRVARIAELGLQTHHGYANRQEQTVNALVGTRQLPGTPEETRKQIEALREHERALTTLVDEARRLGPAFAGQPEAVPVESKDVTEKG